MQLKKVIIFIVEGDVFQIISVSNRFNCGIQKLLPNCAIFSNINLVPIWALPMLLVKLANVYVDPAHLIYSLMSGDFVPPKQYFHNGPCSQIYFKIEVF
jgi:hypothetical protein